MSMVPHAHVLATIDRRDSKPPKFHKILSACSMSQNGQLELPQKFLMEYGDKIGKEVTMRGKLTEVKNMNVCFGKSGRIGSLRISIGSGWREFRTTNGLKAGDYVVFTLIAPSTFEVEVVDNKACKKLKHALQDGADHGFPSRIPCFATIHRSRRKRKRATDETEAINMIDNVFAQFNLFLAQQVSPLLLPSSIGPAITLFPRNSKNFSHRC
ncbi:unnamed protein product [Sphagnum jensenii]|uniref:TF-B3 domain-containing protein n=1 Tax=Sphagnum jensenii TaxID=128206 RepID=A0ABP0W5E4_9BRYO